jgi:hypothetical protein
MGMRGSAPSSPGRSSRQSARPPGPDRPDRADRLSPSWARWSGRTGASSSTRHSSHPAARPERWRQARRTTAPRPRCRRPSNRGETACIGFRLAPVAARDPLLRTGWTRSHVPARRPACAHLATSKCGRAIEADHLATCGVAVSDVLTMAFRYRIGDTCARAEAVAWGGPQELPNISLTGVTESSGR